MAVDDIMKKYEEIEQEMLRKEREFKCRIRTWYMENYSTDELGTEISATATFEGLFDTLDQYRDVYDYIGVGDSLVRERCFAKLAQLIDCEYKVIYDQWLRGA